MPDTSHISILQHVDTQEIDELRELSRRFPEQPPGLRMALDDLEICLEERLRSASHPAEAEQAVEDFVRSLRHAWLTAAGAEAAGVQRAPTAGETRRIARCHDAFGYERDLQPESLEERCQGFYPSPPPGWRQDHVIFSSGQAAMTAALLGLGEKLKGETPLRLVHRGAYFETKSLLRLLPFIIEATFVQTADIVIDEPVCCDGQFHQFDTSKLLAASPRAVIFDTTLLGRRDDIGAYLAALDPAQSPVVVRIVSGLKLFEGGLELANAGIASVYERETSAAGFGGGLRRIRTLVGAGLSHADALALEAPPFLDPDFTDRYAAAVFEHNARLAEAIEAANRRFAPVTHPSFSGGVAPYCVVQIPDGSASDYDALEKEIEAEARRRRLNLDHGGSFGYRAPRFEPVRPETGEPPFLRIAMGRRGGWSCEGIIEMMSAIASR